MTRITINIRCDSAAFADDHMLEEVARILEGVPRKVLQQLARPPALCVAVESPDLLYDVNGNQCGSVVVRRPPIRPCVFGWSGEIPCTGVFRCLYCKRVGSSDPASQIDYSKVDRTSPCPARSQD